MSLEVMFRGSNILTCNNWVMPLDVVNLWRGGGGGLTHVMTKGIIFCPPSRKYSLARPHIDSSWIRHWPLEGDSFDGRAWNWTSQETQLATHNATVSNWWRHRTMLIATDSDKDVLNNMICDTAVTSLHWQTSPSNKLQTAANWLRNVAVGQICRINV